MRKAAALQARTVGPVAREVLAAGGDVEVLAVFERSAYLLLGQGIVCAGLPSIGNGPLNLIVPPREGIAEETPFGLQAGMKGGCDGARIELAPDIAIGLAAAEVWVPAPWPACTDPAAGVAALVRAARDVPMVDGIAPLLLAPQSAATRTATARAAADSVRALSHAVPAAMATGVWPVAGARAATLLIGLGPGLTPSGDDLLGGVLLGLSALGHSSLRDALWDIIAGELDDLTVPISAMHLAAAADGLGAEAMHDLIAAVLAGSEAEIAARFPAVACLGATSGLDAVAGFLIALAPERLGEDRPKSNARL